MWEKGGLMKVVALKNQNLNELPVERERRIDPWARWMDQMFESFLNDFPAVATNLPAPYAQEKEEFLPAIDIHESERFYKVVVELPGLDEKNMIRTERAYGSFYRTIPFRAEIDEAKVEAMFKNGLLTVVLPKTEHAVARARKINIRSS